MPHCCWPVRVGCRSEERRRGVPGISEHGAACSATCDRECLRGKVTQSLAIFERLGDRADARHRR